MNFISTNNYPIPVHQNSSEALSENTESFTEAKEGWGCEKQEWLEELIVLEETCYQISSSTFLKTPMISSQEN